MKGQSLIIEFMLFFLISFSLFALTSSFFYSQNNLFKERIGEKLTETVSGFVLADIISGTTCQVCDNIRIEEASLPPRIGGYYYRILLDVKGINATLAAEKSYSAKNQMFNLNKTFNLIESQVKSENKIVEIQISNINNEIVIGQ